jgi:acetyltransferase-like isoleucine patch superfamily enzyme
MNRPKINLSGIRDVTCGKNVEIVSPSNLYECTLGDKCFVGPFVEIQNGVKIGNRCRIQSHSFICELVTIGDDCFISHGAKFVNDLFSNGGPARSDRKKYKSTTLGDNVSIGTNATVLPVNICSNVVIGAGSVVTKDISSPGIYAGNPAKLIRKLDV